MEGKEVFIDVSISFYNSGQWKDQRLSISDAVWTHLIKNATFYWCKKEVYFIIDNTFEVIFLNF